MTISRRLRFEILRRDNHTCRYCGATAEDDKLTVDHVVPQALGGSDDPSNLVASCATCNGGKTSIAPDQPLVGDVATDAIRWAKAMEYVAETQREQREELDDRVGYFDELWREWHYASAPNRLVPRPNNWRTSIERFLTLGLDLDVLEEKLQVAMTKPLKTPNVWAYFCGCCWRELDNWQRLAKELVDRDEVPL